MSTVSLFGLIALCTSVVGYLSTLPRPNPLILKKVPPCQKELTNYLAMQKNAFPVLGGRQPVCDSNGYYAPKQCSGSQCYCVMKEGKEIDGYIANILESSKQTCQCARDKAEYASTRMWTIKKFSCTSDGSYLK